MLTIRHIRHWYEPRLPHVVFLDGLYAGMVGQDDCLLLDAPRGTYDLKVQFGGRVPLGKSGKSIDIIVWVVSWFVQMPPVYKILSDAFFAVWLVRLVLIRKSYYIITESQNTVDPDGTKI